MTLKINRKQKFKLLPPSYEKLQRPEDSVTAFLKSAGAKISFNYESEIKTFFR